MPIWVDADACPKVIKEVLYRAAERSQTELILVANQPLSVPPSRFIRTLRVAAGFDVADNEIVQRVSREDLVITADIPLAAEVLAKGAAALNPRGERYSDATIRERLTMRDFMDTMRASGVQTGGPATLNQRDRQQFAAELDKWLLQQRRHREQGNAAGQRG
ncbi:YaiI/YqxD family protein [Pantoea sp. FN0302]|uniref:YaiI/YqxD family protein n=1 Tax=unclassified Pantoea TaxID=2630326 RepID=UPI003CF467F8